MSKYKTVVTACRIIPIDDEGKCKAIVNLTLNDDQIIYNCKIMARNDGQLFFALPSEFKKTKQKPDGAWFPLVVFEREKHQEIQNQVLEQYQMTNITESPKIGAPNGDNDTFGF